MHTYQGTVIEQSLEDKSVLKEVAVSKSVTEHDWVLHTVFVNENQFERLQKALADGRWYIHLWNKEIDSLTVIFKNKIFNTTLSNPETQIDAITYGESIGIPKEQLDFLVIES